MKKYTKIVSLLIVLAMMATCLVACGGPTPEQQAETAVNTCLNALKAGDLETAAKYLDDADVTSVDDTDEDSMVNSVIMEKIFAKLEHKILSTQKIDDNTVTVKAEITNLDMKPVFTEFFTQALQYALGSAFSENPPSEEETNEEMTKIFDTCISKEDLATVTKEVEIKVVKTEDQWILQSSDLLSDALLGGLEKVVEEIQESFSGLGES